LTSTTPFTWLETFETRSLDPPLPSVHKIEWSRGRGRHCDAKKHKTKTIKHSNRTNTDASTRI